MGATKEYRFAIILEPREEGGYFAQCPVFPGGHVEGETYEETIAEMKKLSPPLLKIIKKTGKRYRTRNLR